MCVSILGKELAEGWMDGEAANVLATLQAANLTEAERLLLLGYTVHHLPQDRQQEFLAALAVILDRRYRAAA